MNERKDKEEQQKEITSSQEEQTEKKEEFTEEDLKDLEQQLKKMLEEDQEIQKKRRLVLFFHYALHDNFSWHILLQWLVNLFVLSAVIGISGYIKINQFGQYLLSIMLFTFAEILLKLIVIKFLPKIVVNSFGLFHLIYTVPLFYGLIVLFGNVTFQFYYQIFLVMAFFFLLRLAVSYYIKLIFFGRRNKK